MAIEFKNLAGESIPEDKFRAIFGEFVLTTDPDATWAIKELAAVEGFTALRVLVLDEDGEPVPDHEVVFSWPGEAIVALTKENGYAELGMGGDSYYWPPEKGPYKMEIGDGEFSETVDGGGMVGLTNHLHFDTVFQWRVDEQPGDAVEHLLAAQAKNTEVAALIARALELAQEG